MEDVLKDFFNVGLFFTVTLEGTGSSFSLQQKRSVTYKPMKITKLKKCSYTIIHVLQPPFWVAQESSHQIYIYSPGKHVTQPKHQVTLVWVSSCCVNILL